jgi:hypothetical protein
VEKYHTAKPAKEPEVKNSFHTEGIDFERVDSLFLSGRITGG